MNDYLGYKRIGEVKESWLTMLSDDELAALVAWEETKAYRTLKKALDFINASHIRAVVANPLNADSILVLSERRGSIMEGNKILQIPTEAKAELERRHKLIK